MRELLKREIGEILRREFPVEEAGMLSVNDVVTSNDLKSAIVFVSVLGTNAQKAGAGSLLSKSRSRIRGILGQTVTLKYTPGLKFVIDDSITRGNRVLALIEELEKENPENEGDA